MTDTKNIKREVLQDWLAMAHARFSGTLEEHITAALAAPQPVQPAPLSDRHTAELKALSMLLRNMEGPVTLSAKKIAIAEAIEAAVRTGGAG